MAKTIERDWFAMAKDNLHILKDLTREERGDLLTAIYCHRNGLELPEMDRATIVAFRTFEHQFDAYDKAYEETRKIRKENGKKGGRPPKRAAEEETAPEERQEIRQEPEPEPAPPVLPAEKKPAKESEDIAPTWKTATTEKEKRFCRFWDSYPRKVGKLKVWKLWDRMNYSEDLTGRMIEAVEKQRNSYEWKKNGGQYIPHPLTWLNRGGWDDEIGEEAGYGTGQRSASRQQFKDRGIDYDAILRDFERSHGEGNDV